MCRAAPIEQISAKLDKMKDIANFIDSVKFHVDRCGFKFY